MPLVNVKDLVTHASRHGYLVASFKVFSSETIQAVVAAAERTRAPVILAIDTPSSTYIDHVLNLVAAESAAQRASIPVAIEAVYRYGDPRQFVQPYPASSVSLGQLGNGCGDNDAAAVPVTLTQYGDHGCAIEWWGSCSQLVSGKQSVPKFVDFIGVTPQSANDGSRLRPRTIRDAFASIRANNGLPLVVSGDMDWSDSISWALPDIGVAKINFDRRLLAVSATAAKRAAEAKRTNYWSGAEQVFSTLVEEVSVCLRRSNSTGRAADVLGFSRSFAGRGVSEAAPVGRRPSSVLAWS